MRQVLTRRAQYAKVLPKTREKTTVAGQATRSGRRTESWVKFEPFLEPHLAPKLLGDSLDGVLGSLRDCASPGNQPICSSRIGTNSRRNSKPCVTPSSPRGMQASTSSACPRQEGQGACI